jgi:benzoylformate decarboxylase/acetolactate synthase-1/2/3 large subunit
VSISPAHSRRYGSDLVVEFLIERGVRYVALNPGASFRGLHDSLVNTPGAPEIILCPHEKQAVNVAHGYARATGEVGVAIVHDIVGLLHGSLGIFTALHDRTPVMVLGGAGPMNSTLRRPWIEWLHTANVQGNAVRDFTKFDDQPTEVEAIPHSLVRAWRVALTEPAGPVYEALDAELQEAEVGPAIPHYEPSRVGPASPIGPDERTLTEAVRLLADARRPVIVAGHAGRDPLAFRQVPALAELLAAAIVDTGHRLNAPNAHPLHLGPAALDDADVVLLLDVKNPDRQLSRERRHERGMELRLPIGAKVVDVGFHDYHVRSWVQDSGAIVETDVRLLADTRVALPLLAAQLRDRVAPEGARRAAARDRRRAVLGAAHDAQRSKWAAEAANAGATRPIATAWLAREAWAAIREEDWVLAGGTANQWVGRLWDFDRSYRHAGMRIDAANQIGTAIGIALAHRDTSRLVVDVQPDGDLMYDLGALWTASSQAIPLLVVMFNNRAYYNDFGHQQAIAAERGSDPERITVGLVIEPTPDYARIAQGMGWHAEGPVTDPAEVRNAIARAAKVVLQQRTPALVDVICQYR